MSDINWDLIKKELSNISEDDLSAKDLNDLKNGLQILSNVLVVRGICRDASETFDDFQKLSTQTIRDMADNILTAHEVKPSIMEELRSAWHAFWSNVYDEEIPILLRNLSLVKGELRSAWSFFWMSVYNEFIADLWREIKLKLSFSLKPFSLEEVYKETIEWKKEYEYRYSCYDSWYLASSLINNFYFLMNSGIFAYIANDYKPSKGRDFYFCTSNQQKSSLSYVIRVSGFPFIIGIMRALIIFIDLRIMAILTRRVMFRYTRTNLFNSEYKYKSYYGEVFNSIEECNRIDRIILFIRIYNLCNSRINRILNKLIWKNRKEL